MVRLDDRLPPVVFDAAARARLTAALDREGVVAAYLFGSRALDDLRAFADAARRAAGL